MFNPYDYYISPEEYDIAESYGVSQRLVNDRIRDRGWEKKRALTTPTQIQKDRSEIVAKAKLNGISYNQLMARLHIGWNEERAATAPIRNAKEHSENALKMCQLNRKLPVEMLKLAEENGIKYSSFTHRLRAGWDILRAATTPTSYSNGAMRLKELHGEHYLEDWMEQLFKKR